VIALDDDDLDKRWKACANYAKDVKSWRKYLRPDATFLSEENYLKQMKVFSLSQSRADSIPLKNKVEWFNGFLRILDGFGGPEAEALRNYGKQQVQQHAEEARNRGFEGAQETRDPKAVLDALRALKNSELDLERVQWTYKFWLDCGSTLLTVLGEDGDVRTHPIYALVPCLATSQD